MRGLVLLSLCLSLPLLVVSASTPQKPTGPNAFPALERQVQLDRAGFSPGEIDGKDGSNSVRAFEAYTRAQAAPFVAADTLVPYVLTAADVAGPYEPIPADMMDKAKLKSLGYVSLMEALGERFHSSPALLEALNAGKQFVAGARITVPNVRITQEPVAGSAAATASAAKIVVSKTASNLTAFDAAGAVIFYAPVTSGSEHDPLPIGDWLVSIVRFDPKFNYNPDLFWDADPAHTKTQLAAGPNGPVGVVWIQISKENYGIHGTAEPGMIGHSESHGCVRLTNWDALTVAGLVKKGTPVVFIE
jgi:lipoprotein-anchoring transpeptidase ErfK/SrfK